MSDTVTEEINSLMIINPRLSLVLVALMVCRVEQGDGREGQCSHTAVTRQWHVRELMSASAEGEKQALNRAKLEHAYLYHVFKAYLFLALCSHTATNKQA